MKLSEEIIAILDAVCAKFGVAIDWTSENVVPYLTELAGRCVKYELWTSIMWIVLCVFVATLSAIGLAWCVKRAKTEQDQIVRNDYVEIVAVCLAIFLVVALVTAVVGIDQAHDIIACLTFPEKIILNFVQQIR